MAFILPHSVFFHVPKTGGTWVRELLERQQLLTACTVLPEHAGRPFGVKTHTGILSLDSKVAAGRLLFAFIRHPLTWHQSHWLHRIHYGWPPDTASPWHACKSDTFTGYLELYLQQCPGQYTRDIEAIIGPLESTPVVCGRFEHLVDDFVHILRTAGETFNEEQVRAFGRINQAQQPVELCSYSPELSHAVLQSEQKLVQRFYQPATVLTH